MRRNGEATRFAERHQEIMAQGRRRLLQSRLHSHALVAVVSAAKKRLVASHALLSQCVPPVVRMTPVRAGRDGAALGGCGADEGTALRRADVAPGRPGGAGRSFSAVDDLIATVEHAVVRDADAVDGLIEQIKALLCSETDHYLLIGVLLEGMAQAISHSIPATERPDAVRAALALLVQRIGTLQGVR